MLKIIAISSILMLAGCTTQKVTPDASSSVINFAHDVNSFLVAQRVDGVRVDEGRYFRVLPGQRELEVLVVNTGEENAFPSNFVKLSYEFTAGTDYQLRAQDIGGRLRSIELRTMSGDLLKRVPM